MTGRIAVLSERALHLAAGLTVSETARLARWLYRFGRVPRGPEIERNFGHGDDPMGVLGLTPGGTARDLLEGPYEVTTFPGWLSFARESVPFANQAACKLYVSPLPAALATAFPAVAEVFARMKVRSFKVGRGIEGLLRPDKLVAYFDDRDHLNRVAEALGKRLAGCPAQPVPFTAEAGGDGLLSWASDPPLGSDGVSWRSWITRRLADGLMRSHATTASDAAAAALRHVAAQGVDFATWTIGRFPASGSPA
jgi:hypothetical protein